MKQSFLFKPLGVSIIVTALLAVGLFVGGADFLTDLELQQLDHRMKHREREPRDFPKNIVLVEINNRSLHYEKRWPWGWDAVAELLDKIRKAEPRVIALELPLFDRPDTQTARAIEKLNEAFVKRNPTYSKEQLVKVLRAVSRRKRPAFLAKLKETEALKKQFVGLKKKDPIGALVDVVKKTPQLVLGFRYFRRINDVPGLDMRYLKRKEKASKEKAKSKKAKAKKAKAKATATKFHYMKFPIKLFDVGSPSFLLGAASDPAPEVYGTRENAYIASYVRYHGFTNIADTPQMVLRKIPLFARTKNHTHPSLALAAYIAARKGNVPKRIVGPKGYISLELGTSSIPLTHKGEMWINYYGAMNRIPTEQRLLAGDILAGKNSRADDIHSKIALDVKDKTVLVGFSSKEFGGQFQTPFRRKLTSLEIQATALANLDERSTISRNNMTRMTELGILVFLGLLLGLLMMRLRIIGGLLVLVVFYALINFVDRFYVFPTGTWLHLLYVELGLFVIYFLVNVVRTVTGDKLLHLLQGRFRERLAPSELQTILRTPEVLQPQGVWRPLTVLSGGASPLGGALNEEFKPESAVRLLSQLTLPVSEAVFRNQGTLNWLSGHRLQAMFGAPVQKKDHAELACTAALQIRFEWEAFIAHWQQEGLPLPNLELALDSAPSLVGNIGSQERFIYTPVGSAVENSERMRYLGRHYQSQILLSESLATLLQERGKFLVRELDWVRFQDDQAAITIFELLGDRASGQLPNEVTEWYRQGLEQYRSRQFQEASHCFQELVRIRPQDGPAQVMLQRCQHYIHYPPSFQWDGAWKMSGV